MECKWLFGTCWKLIPTPVLTYVNIEIQNSIHKVLGSFKEMETDSQTRRLLLCDAGHINKFTASVILESNQKAVIDNFVLFPCSRVNFESEIKKWIICSFAVDVDREAEVGQIHHIAPDGWVSVCEQPSSRNIVAYTPDQRLGSLQSADASSISGQIRFLAILIGSFINKAWVTTEIMKRRYKNKTWSFCLFD